MPPDAKQPPPARAAASKITGKGINPQQDTNRPPDLVGRLDRAVRRLDAHRAALALIAAEIAVIRDDVERFGLREVTT